MPVEVRRNFHGESPAVAVAIDRYRRRRNDIDRDNRIVWIDRPYLRADLDEKRPRWGVMAPNETAQHDVEIESLNCFRDADRPFVGCDESRHAKPLWHHRLQ